MPILNYTTEVPTMKTVGEIHGILVQHGAESVSTDYRDGKPIAVSFSIRLNGNALTCRLPTNPGGVLRSMMSDPKVSSRKATEAQAERVSWRIIKDWLEAQMAIVVTNQAEMAEVFLPYVITDRSGLTVYQQFKEHNQKQLAEGAGQ